MVVREVQVSIEAVHSKDLFGTCLPKIDFLDLHICSCSFHQLLKIVCLNESEGSRD